MFKEQINANDTLLDWNSVQHKLPWNVVLLLGSGFAIAEAADVIYHPLYKPRNLSCSGQHWDCIGCTCVSRVLNSVCVFCYC